jgi:integrase
MKLTAKSIAGLSLGERSDIIHFDDDLAGFGYRLRRSPSGKVNASWIVQYRRGGASRRVLLGAGNVISADQARTAAKTILAKVQLGEDPQQAKSDRRSRDQLSVRAMVDEFLEQRRPRLRPKTYNELVRYLTGPYLRQLHGMAVDSVTRKDVASALVRMQRQHTPIVMGLARTALSSFFVWCLQMGLCEANPVLGTPQPERVKSRERVLSDEELAAIWNAAINQDYARIIRLLILTGCRRQECGGMTWGELDFARGVWVIPSDRTKNHRNHTLPLLPMMLDIIETVPHRAGRAHLFGDRAKVGFGDWGRSKTALDRLCPLEKPWVIHDIRRSVATGMINRGVTPFVVEAVLNHFSGHRAGIAGVYNKSSYEREIRSALVLWHDHMRTLIDGSERRVLSFTAS